MLYLIICYVWLKTLKSPWLENIKPNQSCHCFLFLSPYLIYPFFPFSAGIYIFRNNHVPLLSGRTFFLVREARSMRERVATGDQQKNLSLITFRSISINIFDKILNSGGKRLWDVKTFYSLLYFRINVMFVNLYLFIRVFPQALMLGQLMPPGFGCLNYSWVFRSTCPVLPPRKYIPLSLPSYEEF